jgi:hypothetical protein
LRNRLNFDLDKNFITDWKSVTKLVIFQSFVAKCCKMRVIYIALRSLQFSVILDYMQTGNWQPNTLWGIFAILLILWCSSKLWWNFCLDLLRSKFGLLRKWSIENTPYFAVSRDQLQPGSFCSARACEGETLGTIGWCKPLQLWNSNSNEVKFKLKFWHFSCIKFA